MAPKMEHHSGCTKDDAMSLILVSSELVCSDIKIAPLIQINNTAKKSYPSFAAQNMFLFSFLAKKLAPLNVEVSTRRVVDLSRPLLLSPSSFPARGCHQSWNARARVQRQMTPHTGPSPTSHDSVVLLRMAPRVYATVWVVLNATLFIEVVGSGSFLPLSHCELEVPARDKGVFIRARFLLGKWLEKHLYNLRWLLTCV